MNFQEAGVGMGSYFFMGVEFQGYRLEDRVMEIEGGGGHMTLLFNTLKLST